MKCEKVCANCRWSTGFVSADAGYRVFVCVGSLPRKLVAKLDPACENWLPDDGVCLAEARESLVKIDLLTESFPAGEEAKRATLVEIAETVRELRRFIG
jgi:hypothetical protein